MLDVLSQSLSIIGIWQAFPGTVIYLSPEKGFEWGGDWTDRKDYQHFELKP